MESADTEPELASLRADGEHARGDVCRILQMMRERGLGNLHRRDSMRKSDRPERRIAGRRGIDVSDRSVADIHRIFGGKLHEEIMRMLPIDQRLPMRGLAGLEQLGIAALPEEERLQAQHRAKHQVSGPELALGDAHEPVRGEELVAAAVAGLHDLASEQRGVVHQHPAAVVEHRHVHRRGCGVGARSRRLLRQKVGHGVVLHLHLVLHVLVLWLRLRLWHWHGHLVLVLRECRRAK